MHIVKHIGRMLISFIKQGNGIYTLQKLLDFKGEKADLSARRGERGIIMKTYVVRLRNYRGSIIDGEIYEAVNKDEALKMYKARCRRLNIDVCKYDYFTVDEWVD